MKFHLTWSLGRHPEGIEGDQIPEGHGGATALLLCSVLLPEDGSTSVAFIAADGRGGEMAPMDRFKVWAMLAFDLANETRLPDGHRELAATVHASVVEAVQLARAVRPRRPPTDVN